MTSSELTYISWGLAGSATQLNDIRYFNFCRFSGCHHLSSTRGDRVINKEKRKNLENYPVARAAWSQTGRIRCQRAHLS